MTDVFAVGAIDGRETELARLGCYQSRTEIVLSGKAPLNDFDRYPADDGNAVPALLPVRVYLIAKGVERPLNVVKHSVRGRRSHSHGRPG